MVSGVIDTAEHQKSRFYSRMSPQIQSHMQKGLTRVSGAQMELFDEKNSGRKSCDRVPLTNIQT
jgi:hypothetical protein